MSTNDQRQMYHIRSHSFLENQRYHLSPYSYEKPLVDQSEFYDRTLGVIHPIPTDRQEY